MGIYIKDMEMPERGHTITITIAGSGQAYVEYFDCRPHVKETIEYTAVPVPPHGRLIDADALIKNLEISSDGGNNGAALLRAAFLEVLKATPTVIPSEEKSKEEDEAK